MGLDFEQLGKIYDKVEKVTKSLGAGLEDHGGIMYGICMWKW